MVVEDSPKVCEGIEDRMEDYSNWRLCGFAHHVEEAKLLANKERPDLIFIDWSLKGGSAFEVLQSIQNIADYSPYIIFNTGYQGDNPEIPQEIINNYPVDKYLIKPFWEKLRQNLSNYIHEAEEKAQCKKDKNYLFLTDVSKKRVRVNLDDLICICKDAGNSYNKVLYFHKGDALNVRIRWQDILLLLEEHYISFFISNSKEHIVVRKFIEQYKRPFVKLKGFPHKIEVVKDKLHEFEGWLKKL